MSFSKMLAVLLTWLKLTGQWDGSWGWVVLWVLVGGISSNAPRINIINRIKSGKEAE